MLDSEPSRKPHPLLEPDSYDAEMADLTKPPVDLPKPWDGAGWRRWFTVSFFLTLFGLWYIGNKLNISVINDLPGSCSISFGIFLFLGLFLINRFGMRGFQTNYAARKNRPLNDAMRRYRNKKMDEGFYQLFARYIIDDVDYYLVWYVPHQGPGLTRSLGPGAEPLIFDSNGQWLEDEDLFVRALLMFTYGIEFSPGSFQDSKVSDHNGLRKMTLKYMPRLPELLEMNSQKFIERGMQTELRLVLEAYPARAALMRSSINFFLGKIQWARAHGGESLIQMRYEDILRYHESIQEVRESRGAFRRKYRLDEAEESGSEIRNLVAKRMEAFRGWQRLKQLDESLQVFSAPIPDGPTPYYTKQNGRWMPKEEVLDSYRSRVAYAREVDAKRRSYWVRP